MGCGEHLWLSTLLSPGTLRGLEVMLGYLPPSIQANVTVLQQGCCSQGAPFPCCATGGHLHQVGLIKTCHEEDVMQKGTSSDPQWLLTHLCQDVTWTSTCFRSQEDRADPREGEGSTLPTESLPSAGRAQTSARAGLTTDAL